MLTFTRTDRPNPGGRMGPTITTTGTTIQPEPHEVRERARTATYPNRETEHEVIKSIDEAVFEKVRIHEQRLIGQGRAVIEQRKADETAAIDIIVSLRESVLYPLLDGALPDAESAAQYKSLLAQAEQAKARLVAADRDAEIAARHVADPYADLMGIYKKYPTLRPVIR